MYGFLRIVTPGLIYVKRASLKADPVSLPSDPSNVAAPVEGELLVLNAAGDLIRPANVGGVSTPDAAQVYTLLVDKSRTDVQSQGGGGASKLSVMIEKGVLLDTDAYAKSAAGVAITYPTVGAGSELVVGVWREDAAGTVLRSGYVPVGTAVGVPAGAGDLVAIGTRVVATTVRGIHQENGVSAGNRKNVITVITK